MMGIKARMFGPLPPLTLEELVPADHVSRHVERTLDLGFVRALVRDAYAKRGRPSIDPVVCFELQLVVFFEGLRAPTHAGRRRPTEPALTLSATT
jgi:transposase